MATTDANIGSLKKATHLDADSLLVAEQQGEAVAVEGALFADFARQAVAPQVKVAEDAAKNASESAERIENMCVEAVSLSHDREATVTKTSGADAVTLTFGIPNGKSAYQYAVDSGYTGTEKEFMQKLAAEAGVFYVADGGTPHSVDTQVFDGGTPFTTDEIKLDGGMP